VIIATQVRHRACRRARAVEWRAPAGLYARARGIRTLAECRLDCDGQRGALMHRDLLVKLAAQHKLVAVYYKRLYVTAGGSTDQAAGYIDARLFLIIDSRSFHRS
jgi:hypothetical protein